MKLSPKIQNQLTQFEQIRQQLQMLTNQRIQIESHLRELENALEELGKTPKNRNIYKRIGLLFVKVENKNDLKTDLNEQKDNLDLRIQTLERQEKQLRERYTELQQDISKAVQGLEQ